MRRDVKLGIVVSMLFVLCFGGYYVLREKRATPINLADAARGKDAATKAAAGKAPSGATPPKANPANRTAGDQPPRPTPRNQPQHVTIPPQGGAPNPAATGNPGANPRAASNAPPPAQNPAQSTPTSPPGGTSSAPMNPAGAAPPDQRIASGQGSVPAVTPTQTELNRPMTMTGVPAETNAHGSNDRMAANTPKEQTVPGTAGQPKVLGPSRIASGDSSAPAPARGATGTTNPGSALSSPLPTGASSPNPTVGMSAATERNLTNDAERAAVETHRVQPGDSLASIAQTYYGSERYVPFLIDNNPGIGDPAQLGLGTVVKIPPQPSKPANPMIDINNTTTAKSPSGAKPTASHRTYQVRHGDSFYAIARDVLGDASRWKELLALNSDMVKGDPTRLRIGQKVVLPES